MNPEGPVPQAAGSGMQATVATRKLVLAYVVFAGLWILLSDAALGWLSNDPAHFVLASTIKGWLFVAVTSLLLYYLIRRLAGQIQDAGRRELDSQTEKLRALNLLEAIADASSDAIFAKDIDDRFVVFNRASERLTGKPAAEVLGRDEMAVFPPEIAQNLIEDNRRVMMEDRAIAFQEDLLTAEGWRTYLTTKGPMHDSNGELVGMFGVARDITERKLVEQTLRESEERYRSLFENNMDGVLLTTPDGGILAANPEAQRLLGYSEDELRRIGRAGVIDSTDSRLALALAQRERTGRFRGELTLIGKDGTKVPVELSSLVFEDQSGRAFTSMIIRDITGRKLAEQKILTQLDELLRWQRLTIGREERMLQLKAEVNELLARQGEPARYPGQAD